MEFVLFNLSLRPIYLLYLLRVHIFLYAYCIHCNILLSHQFKTIEHYLSHHIYRRIFSWGCKQCGSQTHANFPEIENVNYLSAKIVFHTDIHTHEYYFHKLVRGQQMTISTFKTSVHVDSISFWGQFWQWNWTSEIIFNNRVITLGA